MIRPEQTIDVYLWNGVRDLIGVSLFPTGRGWWTLGNVVRDPILATVVVGVRNPILRFAWDIIRDDFIHRGARD